MERPVSIRWSERLETGIAEVDAQHRTLVDLINALGGKYGAGAAPEEVAEILAELERYSVYHFTAEETLMAAQGFPSARMEAHCASHRNFVSLLRQAGRLVRTSPDDVVGQLMAFLLKWLVFHIGGEDMRMARALRAGTPDDGLPVRNEEIAFGDCFTETLGGLYERLGARSLEMVALNARLQDELERSRRLEAELRASERRWKMALEASSDGVWDWHVATGLVFYSSQPTATEGAVGGAAHAADEWWGRIHAEDAPAVMEARRRCLEGESPSFACEFRRRGAAGERWILSKGIVIGRDGAGRPTRMIGTHQDITARKQADAAVARLAHYDPLTGLPNRVLFRVRAEQALAQARRSGEQPALLYLDLDHFKPVNDCHGHDVGDALLGEVARRLQACIRSSDVACRQGGDEFLVLLTALCDDGEADEIAARVRLALAEPYLVQGLRLAVTVSIGIAHFPAHGRDFDALVRHADLAMYGAKGAGGNGAMCARKEEQWQWQAA